jgi:hypothetical protein
MTKVSTVRTAQASQRLMTTAALIAATAIATLASTQAVLIPMAHADESRLSPYFEKIEGHWTGTGSIQQLNASGLVTTTAYSAEIQADRDASQDGVWNATNHVVDQFGVSNQSALSFTVAGDALLVSVNGSQPEAVKVVKTSPLSLGYEIDRTDTLTGRQYQFIYYTEVDASGTRLQGHNTTLSGGVTVGTDTFELHRD